MGMASITPSDINGGTVVLCETPNITIDIDTFTCNDIGPNNVTLTIAGDFDTAQAKQWVEKYFNDIKRGEDIPEMEKQPVVLSETKKVYYEDNFARLPQLNLTWSSVYQYHKDSYALKVLATYLSEGKKAPLYKTLVEQEQLTASVSMFQSGSEIAGEFTLRTTAFSNTDLDEVEKAIFKALLDFEANGISETDLIRIKAGQETGFYNSLSSVLGKGAKLAQYEIFAGDAAFINQDVKNILAVTPEDVISVYNTYIKGKHYVATSFVPKNQANLALQNSTLADIVEEKIIKGAEEQFDASIAATYKKTPSSFDRSIEPPYGDNPDVKVPSVWKDELSSGIGVFGIENNEVPLVQFQMQLLKVAQLLEDAMDKLGLSYLLAAQLLTKGTRDKTVTRTIRGTLYEELRCFYLCVLLTHESVCYISGTHSLLKNYGKPLALVAQEMLLSEPRLGRNKNLIY